MADFNNGDIVVHERTERLGLVVEFDKSWVDVATTDGRESWHIASCAPYAFVAHPPVADMVQPQQDRWRSYRGAILDRAKVIINGERQDQYGNPEDSFQRIADLWNGYFAARGDSTMVSPQDVAYLMVLFKLARQVGGAGKEDNLTDAAGYLAIAADMDLDGMENIIPRDAVGD